jgi:photosystem II stability/assembly factor-like uncharacterized protein
MRLKFIAICTLLLASAFANAQFSWQILPSSPFQIFRHDDVCFVNSNLGWVGNIRGEIWKTRDGGNTWNKLISQNTTAYRCIGFVDSSRGFAGNLGLSHWNRKTTDTMPLYRTLDGGITWAPIEQFNGPKPKGLCGLQVVNDSVIVACGRIDGPAFFVRSIDGGKTWTSKDMSAYAGMLIDVFFTSPTTGFAVGGTSQRRYNSTSIILYTTDGGQTWTTKIKSKNDTSHCWKISHPSKNVFYVSIEKFLYTSTLDFFKSTDGGATWTENPVKGVSYGSSQGIGFLNDSIGWVGGHEGALYTTNGGKTFNPMPPDILMNLNRMRFVNDTLGYAVGQRIYKYSRTK